ncbi:hypothetical protein [Marinobacter sp. AN1]|uniref:hypothetical protein n=1 Tax=Marinobacter sp. AN1 TaxID=2886046 RepID=UPI0022326BD7|nr:hypothetical protein [Marinobacter sp. AN1]UZD65753.1 hypothetical protein LJ360_19665 [Marinobacter sp. AN1]
MRLILVSLLLATLLTGCANVSRFEKGPLVAHGEEIDGSGEPLYYVVGIDLGKAGDSRPLEALLRLSPDSPPVSIGALRPQQVARYLPPFVPPPQWPDSWKQKSRENDAYTGGGFHIVFREGRLLSVGICSHCAGQREEPVVGTPDGQHWYALPLTRQQVIDVFGHPDWVHRVNEVRY